jgi:hypothetical protein
MGQKSDAPWGEHALTRGKVIEARYQGAQHPLVHVEREGENNVSPMFPAMTPLLHGCGIQKMREALHERRVDQTHCMLPGSTARPNGE